MALTQEEAEARQVHVEFVDSNQAEAMIRRSLDQVGLSFEELQEQAETRNFQSDLARRTWMVVKSLRLAR